MVKFAVYKDKEGRYVGVEASIGFDGEFVRDVELSSWDDFMKFMIVQYGRVGNYVIRDGKMEFLYDVIPDVVAEFKIRVPIWKFGDGKWAINVCDKNVLIFESWIPSKDSIESMQPKVADIDELINDYSDFFFMMVMEALKKNRFGEIIVDDFEVKRVGGD